MKYALVTGAARGIGKAIAMRLSREGWAVIINYRSSREAAEQVLHEIESRGGVGELMEFDVCDVEAVRTSLDNWYTIHPDDCIDVLVNNAGIRDDSLMVFMSDDQWHRVVDTTLNGFYYLTRAVIEQMVRSRHGRIVNITSVSGISGLSGQVNYSAAKAALIGATKALSKEVAVRKVTVNAVAPGFISTDMTRDLDMKELAKQIPAGRFGTADEVAALVAFLASEEAAYITGQVIAIAGGMV